MLRDLPKSGGMIMSTTCQLAQKFKDVACGYSLRVHVPVKAGRALEVSVRENSWSLVSKFCAYVLWVHQTP